MNLKASMLLVWIISGDFNLVCKVEDNSNSSINRRLMNAFRSAFIILKVSELPLHDLKFTQDSNCQVQTRTKTDHVFCTGEWGLLFPQCHMLSIFSSISDHCAMVFTGQVFQRQYSGRQLGGIDLHKREVEDEDARDLILISFLYEVLTVSCST